jgi:hypothetical protein
LDVQTTAIAKGNVFTEHVFVTMASLQLIALFLSVHLRLLTILQGNRLINHVFHFIIIYELCIFNIPFLSASNYLTTHTSLSPIRRGLAAGFVNYIKGCTRLAAASDKVYQLLAHGRWVSPGTPASSTTKTGHHDIAEILLKVALSTKIKSNRYSISFRLELLECQT